MLHEKKAKILFIAAMFIAATSLQAQSVPTLQEIKTSLTCSCGCNMTVEACQGAMTCDSADQLTSEAQKLIDQGMGKKQILATFVNRYGEHILSAPTKKGFNLTAWITPFLAIVLAGLVIAKIVNRWARRPKSSSNAQKAQNTDSSDAKLEKLLDEVLQKLD